MTQTDVLTAIDEALDAGMATDADPVTRELQELALVLRADSPEPTAAYSEWLDRRVEQGFPRRSSSKPPWWQPLMQPVAAVLLVGVVVLGVAFAAKGLSGPSGDHGSGGSSAASSGSSGASAPSAGGGSIAAESAPDQLSKARSGQGFAPGRAGNAGGRGTITGRAGTRRVGDRERGIPFPGQRGWGRRMLQRGGPRPARGSSRTGAGPTRRGGCARRSHGGSGRPRLRR